MEFFWDLERYMFTNNTGGGFLSAANVKSRRLYIFLPIRKAISVSRWYVQASRLPSKIWGTVAFIKFPKIHEYLIHFLPVHQNALNIARLRSSQCEQSVHCSHFNGLVGYLPLIYWRDPHIIL